MGSFSGTTLNFQQQGLNILSKANMNNFNIPLVFHGQELMDLWKSAVQTVMYSKGRTALILATLVFHPGGFKTTHLQGWNQGLLGAVGEKFSGKTFSGQNSNARLLSEDCRYGKVCQFKKPYKNNFEKLTFQKVTVLFCSSKTWFQHFGLQFLE